MTVSQSNLAQQKMRFKFQHEKFLMYIAADIRTEMNSSTPQLILIQNIYT